MKNLCLSATLLFATGLSTSTLAAPVFLDWGFDDLPLGNIAQGTAINDSDPVRNRFGAANLGGGTLTSVQSPLNADPSNHAVQFNTFHAGTSLQKSFTVDATPANSSELLPTTFTTGVTSRVVAQINDPVAFNASNDFYHYLSRYRLGSTGQDLFGFRYTAEGGVSIRSYVTTASGITQLTVTQAAIETQLGYSILDRMTVFTMDWNPATELLSLYVDGENVGSIATPAGELLSLAEGRFAVGNEGANQNFSRDGIYDEVKVWDGSLSSAEIIADYNSLVPEPGTFALIAFGAAGLLSRNRQARA